jgi:hypothetical protein
MASQRGAAPFGHHQNRQINKPFETTPPKKKHDVNITALTRQNFARHRPNIISKSHKAFRRDLTLRCATKADSLEISTLELPDRRKVSMRREKERRVFMLGGLTRSHSAQVRLTCSCPVTRLHVSRYFEFERRLFSISRWFKSS